MRSSGGPGVARSCCSSSRAAGGGFWQGAELHQHRAWPGGGVFNLPPPRSAPQIRVLQLGDVSPKQSDRGHMALVQPTPLMQAPEHRAGHFGRGDAALPQ